jgi:hypothetical protein
MAMINSAAVATSHEVRVSTDENVGCCMKFALHAARRFFPDATLSHGALRRDAK